MKPFTSKHCTPISYGSPAKHVSQKFGKDNEGHYHYKDKEGKPLAKFSTTPLNQTDKSKGQTGHLPAKKNKLKEQYRPKTGPTGIAPDKRQFEPTNYRFKRGFEADEATLKRLSSTKYKK